jgi:FAD/FMN-containing dehydrogenase/Fe-S oxidoreductase
MLTVPKDATMDHQTPAHRGQPRRHLPLAPPTQTVDLEVLASDLRLAVRGEVRFSAGARALYATDASNYRQLPLGLVVPRDREDIVTAVAICRQHGAPLLMRGGGTSLAGQSCNVAVVLDTSKYVHGVLDLDIAHKRARVLPGTVLDTLRNAAARYDLTFGPDPATHDHCTLGGMIGNNSCGPHAVMAGRTADNVLELDVLTYQGEHLRVGATSPEELAQIIRAGGARGRIYERLAALRDRHAALIRRRYPQIPRRVSGYNLDELLPEKGFHVARALVGTEGTCVTVLEATVRLVDWPRARSLLVLGYPDVYRAAAAIPTLMEHRPLALEGLDHNLVQLIHAKGLHEQYLQYLPQGRAFLLVELGGQDQAEADDRARKVLTHIRRQDGAVTGEVLSEPERQEKIWLVRESGLGATARVPGHKDAWPGWEDSAVPPEKLPGYLRDLHALFDRYGYQAALYGHFGQGCVHCRIDFELTSASGIAAYRAFVGEAAELVVRYGGSLSGEHGDGQSRAELLPKMFGPELVQAFAEFKGIWDPEGKMNPGKVVNPQPIVANLRLGAGYRPAEIKTHFQFPDDDGSMTRATLRCVGVGKCRRTDGGTMCPSYMALREEKHTTRGRAHLLYEMLQEPELRSFRDQEVKESLDLCLACKGCKGDCPVNVDMATYKAEFLAHHYQGRLRPLAAYSMGLIPWWARLSALAPGLVNTVTQSPRLGLMAKKLAGIAPERRIPTFAPRTFQRMFGDRAPVNATGQPVLLWPDTFNNHFFPGTAMAAAEVLEAAGYHVMVPSQSLCCGRPLYDFGMLPTAKRFLRRVMRALREAVQRGLPVVVLEPSCASVFRDELHGLFPRDPEAAALRKSVVTLAELMAGQPERFPLAPIGRTATVHGHCHEKSLWGMSAQRKVLERLGLDYHVVDSGCCGMAGSFGFEAGEKYDVSLRCAERKLLPAVRATGFDGLVIADGFSCREQIRQESNRQALHLAEVARLSASYAVSPGTRTLPGQWPERGQVRDRDDFRSLHPAAPATAAALGAAAFAAGLWLRQFRPRARASRALGSSASLGVAAAIAALGSVLGAAASGVRSRKGHDRPR